VKSTATLTPTRALATTPTRTATTTFTKPVQAAQIATATLTPTVTPSPTINLGTETDIDSHQGGEVHSPDYTIVAQFPTGAIALPIHARFEPAAPDVAKEDRTHQRVIQPFALRAFE
jgi:hypothetical protein